MPSDLVDTSDGVAARLWKLAKYMRERVSEGRKSGTIVEVAAPYVRASATNFSYGDQGAISLGLSYEYVQKPGNKYLDTPAKLL